MEERRYLIEYKWASLLLVSSEAGSTEQTALDAWLKRRASGPQDSEILVPVRVCRYTTGPFGYGWKAIEYVPPTPELGRYRVI